jgi:HEAT repeat protein
MRGERVSVEVREAARDLESPKPNLRRKAVWTLGDIGTRAAARQLTRAMQDEDPSVRWAAAHMMGNLDHTIAVVALAKGARDATAQVRAEATRSLRRIRARQAARSGAAHMEAGAWAELLA